MFLNLCRNALFMKVSGAVVKQMLIHVAGKAVNKNDNRLIQTTVLLGINV